MEHEIPGKDMNSGVDDGGGQVSVDSALKAIHDGDVVVASVLHKHDDR